MPVLLETTTEAAVVETVPVLVLDVVIVAAWLNVNVVALTIALIVVPLGMPKPETACPALKLKYDATVIDVLPLVTEPSSVNGVNLTLQLLNLLPHTSLPLAVTLLSLMS